jgi:transcription antitermination factor NusG
MFTSARTSDNGEILHFLLVGTTPLPWAIIQAQPSSADDEKNPVAKRLRRQDFSVYNPRILRKQDQRPLQLFPGYMFVAGIGRRWGALRTTEGVHKLLMAAPERPAELSDRAVDGIRLQENEQGVIALQDKFVPAQQVRATAGSFWDMIGIYEGQRCRDRVSVLFQLLGQETRVFVAEDNLVAV